MMQTQSFAAKASGMVQAGSASYTADMDNGLIQYAGIIKVGVWIFTKTYQTSGQYRIDPKDLLSQNLNIGKLVQIGETSLLVTNITGSTVTVNIVTAGKQINAIAVGDISGPYLKLKTITAEISGFVSPLSITLNTI